MATLKELKEKYPDASMDEIKRLADKQRPKKPEINLHSWHKFSAVGFFMGFLTFMGLAIIKKSNLLPVMIVLIVLAVAEVIMGIILFRTLKGHRLQQEDELAKELMNKARKMSAATLMIIGGILEIIFAVTDCSFTVNSSNIMCLFFVVYNLVNALKSMYFVILDRVNEEEE